jgi:hypothetical protein
VSSHPGIEFPQGLLKLGRDIIIKKITVLAKDKVLEKIGGSYGALGLLVASLGLGFACGVAMAVIVVGHPKGIAW